MSRDHAPLGRLLGKTAAWSTADVLVGRCGQFAQGVIVARLVAPQYFGIFAIALVVHTVLVNVSELGVHAALIRDDPERTPRTAPTILTISLITSVLLALLVVALAPLLASALGDESAAAPIRVMALNLPLAGLTAVPSGLLRRDFRMKRVFVADTANVVTSGVVVVLLALAGWGALALAWSWVAGQVVTTILLLTYRPAQYWPGWNRLEARRLLAFGLPLCASNLLTFVVLNVDYIVIGRALGAEDLGIYMLAFNISGWPINLFGQVINTISLPGFSRLRLEGAVMSDQFVRAFRFVAGLTLPVCLIIGALAQPAVIAIYGTRWSQASSALVGLSVLAASRILLTLSADYLVSLGRTRAVMLAQLPWLIALTTGLVLVVPTFGIRGAGIVQACVAVLIMGPVYALFLSRAGVNVLAVLKALIRPILWAVLAAAGAYAVSSVIDNPFLACIAGGTLGLLIAAIPFSGTILRHAVRRGWLPGGASATTGDNPAQA